MTEADLTEFTGQIPRDEPARTEWWNLRRKQIEARWPSTTVDPVHWLRDDHALAGLLADIVALGLPRASRGKRPRPKPEDMRAFLAQRTYVDDHHRGPPEPEPEPDLLATRDAATYLGVHKVTLAKWAAAGKGPPSTLDRGRRWYRRSDLDAWKAHTDGKSRYRRFTGDTLMRTSAAAAYLGVHPDVLRHWQVEGKAPPSRRVGNYRVYHRQDLDHFLATRTIRRPRRADGRRITKPQVRGSSGV